MEVYLGVKGRREISFSAKGEDLTFLRKHFSGLTPKLLAQVRPFTERNIVDRIKISEEVVKVPTTMLGTDLRNISLNSHVIFSNTGGEFNTISPVPRTVGDVVEIMHQIFFNKAPYSFKGKGTRYAEMSADIESKRGVTVWLDRISVGTYINYVGIFMSLNRFFSSVKDHAEVVIPLGMTVADEYTT